jgi:hypothetical protein
MLSSAAKGAAQLVGRGSGGDSRVAPTERSPDEDPDAGGGDGKVSHAKVLSQAAGAAAGMVSETVAPKIYGAAGVAASAAVGAASVAAPVAASAASAAAGAAAGGAKQAADAAYQKGQDLAHMSKEKLQEKVRQLRAYLETWVKAKIQAATERVVDRLPGLAKGMLEDPEMPRCVSRGKDRAIDNMWPDIREEIMWEVAVLLDGRSKDDDVPNHEGVDCIRAFFRYHLFPFDKGFWGQIRDPVQLTFRLMSLVPVYGLSQFMFVFIFVLIDKQDEFQCINFILGFKGTQFISMGIIRALTGFSQFMLCVTAPAKGTHQCEDKGPGGNGGMLITSVGLFLQIVLVWTAFILLRYSQEKGRTTLKGHIEHEQGGHARYAGGYIRYFLWYDLAFFIFAALLPIYCVTTRPSGELAHDDWVLAQTVFAGQVIYGLLSVPFFIFTLPGLQRVLTHAMPTGYDRQGRCRKFRKAVPQKEEAKRDSGDLVTEGDAETVFGKVREIVGFG